MMSGTINSKALFATTTIALLLSACVDSEEVGQLGPAEQQGSTVVGSLLKAVNLDQGWTDDTQQSYYFTDQGSRIMPYQWFLVLEQADKPDLFRSEANITNYRYLPASSTSWNPDGLPVGFTKNIDSSANQEWMGVNCAACHTTQIDYQGVAIRIDGGPAMADFETFNRDLVAALNATYTDQVKFDRFADGVLGTGYTPNQAAELRRSLLGQLEVLAQRNLVNRPSPDQPPYGYARLDAVGAIFNQVLSVFNNDPNNGRASNAPVSYPFLWGTHQSDFVQWSGFAPNGPASTGTMIRNGGEVLGVYGQLSIPTDPKVKHYQSSINIENLGKMEMWVAALRSPAWPVEHLGNIDPILAAKGKLHYDKNCIQCHQVIARRDEGQPYKAILTPLSDVATDPTTLLNMVALRPAGIFEGRTEFIVGGATIEATTSGLNPLVNSVVGALLAHPEQTLHAAKIEYLGGVIAEQANNGITSDSDSTNNPEIPSELAVSLNNFGQLDSSPTILADSESQNTASDPGNTTDNSLLTFKARPLNGIWATAPYLHNGSVPNLQELLLPAAQRSKSFPLGSREFDPVTVGFDLQAAANSPNAFIFDTTLEGNSNAGHEYEFGANLSDTERNELLEYLKTL